MWIRNVEQKNVFSDSPSAITLSDAKGIIKTDRLFARKFSEEHLDAVKFVVDNLMPHHNGG